VSTTSYDLYLIEAHAIEKKMLYDVRYQKGKEDNKGICRHNTTEKQKYTTAIHFYFITENEIGGSTEKKERKKNSCSCLSSGWKQETSL